MICQKSAVYNQHLLANFPEIVRQEFWLAKENVVDHLVDQFLVIVAVQHANGHQVGHVEDFVLKEQLAKQRGAHGNLQRDVSKNLYILNCSFSLN